MTAVRQRFSGADCMKARQLILGSSARARSPAVPPVRPAEVGRGLYCSVLYVCDARRVLCEHYAAERGNNASSAAKGLAKSSDLIGI